MAKFLICVFSLFFFGCASTPAEIRASGSRYESTSLQSPSRAADCIARNVENELGFNATTRSGITAGTFEVIAAISGNVGRFPIAVADISPSGQGSSITLRVGSDAFFPDKVKDSMFKGCV